MPTYASASIGSSFLLRAAEDSGTVAALTVGILWVATAATGFESRSRPFLRPAEGPFGQFPCRPVSGPELYNAARYTTCKCHPAIVVTISIATFQQQIFYTVSRGVKGPLVYSSQEGHGMDTDSSAVPSQRRLEVVMDEP